MSADLYRFSRRAAEGGSLVQRAMQAVTDHIRDEGLRVGDTLPGEVHFAAQLGVSRAVLRDPLAARAAMDAHFDASVGDVLRGLSEPAPRLGD